MKGFCIKRIINQKVSEMEMSVNLNRPMLERTDCPECGQPRIAFGWCKECEVTAMRKNFRHWNSGNKKINNLIQYTQINATANCDYLEWIPFEKFELVKYARSGGFTSVYSALWVEGPKSYWDDDAQEWTRAGPTAVALKRLDGSHQISESYIMQIKDHNKCLRSAALAGVFGITKDPTSNYMIVMKHYENGDIYQYLDGANGILSWKDIIDMLWGIAGGLERIHAEGKVHKNLHGGNLLVDEDISIDVRISDVGLHGPCHNFKKSNKIYGVLPFIAPEVLRGEDYTPAFDIYSFGIVMNTLASGKRPWYDRAHDINLAKEICNGKKLEIPEDTPSFYEELMKRCWDNDPMKRPTASQLSEKIGEWITLIFDDPNPSTISDECSVAEHKRWKMSTNLSKRKSGHPTINSEACYTSRVFSLK